MKEAGDLQTLRTINSRKILECGTEQLIGFSFVDCYIMHLHKMKISNFMFHELTVRPLVLFFSCTYLMFTPKHSGPKLPRHRYDIILVFSKITVS